MDNQKPMPSWMKPKGALDHQVMSAIQGVQQEGMKVPPWQQSPPQPVRQYPPCPACGLPQDEAHYRQGCRAQQRPPMMQQQQSWMQPQMQQRPQMQMPPMGQQSPPMPPPMQTGAPPMMPPGVQTQQPKTLPSKKKRRLLYVLIAIMVITALAAIGTGIYFYLNYVR